MDNKSDFEKIKQFVFSEIGLVYYRDKEAELRRKIDKEVKRTSSSGYSQYLKMLEDNHSGISPEFDNLVSELTVGETHFFRDEALFNGFKDIVLPAVIQKNQNLQRLWIWCAGCSTGEEVYSIAILLKKYFSHLLRDWDIRITGTDINRVYLHRAIEGEYAEWSFRGTQEKIRRECFVQHGKTWRIKPEYRKHTSFQYNNLVTMPFPSVFHNLFAFDIIFCRNVMIYFDSETNSKIVRKFQETLVADGWLIVGHADHNIRNFKSFKTVMLPGTSFYQNTIRKPEAVCNNISKPFHMPEAIFSGDTDKSNLSGIATGVMPFSKLNNNNDNLLHKNKDRNFKPQPVIAEEKQSENLSPEILNLLALINCGKWDDASSICEDILSTRPFDADIYLLTAFIFCQKGQTEAAVASLRKAIYLDRKFVIGHYHLGLLLQSFGDLKAAEKCFNNVIKLLNDYDENHVFEIADGITAGQLKILSNFHLEVLKGATSKTFQFGQGQGGRKF